MNHIEAMKQWLEALEKTLRYHGVMLLSDPPQEAWKYHRVEQTVLDAITSLRQAIAEAEKQEPLKYTVNVKCASCSSAETYDMTIGTPQRQPLTDEEAHNIGERAEELLGHGHGAWDMRPLHEIVHAVLSAADEMHGMKEKNT